jgi:hypothetical protein
VGGVMDEFVAGGLEPLAIGDVADRRRKQPTFLGL